MHYPEFIFIDSIFSDHRFPYFGIEGAWHRKREAWHASFGSPPLCLLWRFYVIILLIPRVCRFYYKSTIVVLVPHSF
jgi:hypothetical protein